jgi:hypothetical protein
LEKKTIIDVEKKFIIPTLIALINQL